MDNKVTLPSNVFNQYKISSKDILLLYKDMLLGRIFEDMCAQMYYRGKMFGFVHLYNGQEAVSTGVIKSLQKDDYVCSTYRDHVHALSKGVPSKLVMAELFGKETGCSRGRGGSMHIFSAPHNFLGGFAFIGEGIPIAIGAAFQSVYRKQVLNDNKPMRVTACFFGDGTSNNGQFFECLNMAVLWKLPIIFVVENNQWAIGMAHHRSTSFPEIHKKAEAFGLPGIEVDGMDVLAIREIAIKAINRARQGDGPTLIEALTYRFRGHSLADPDELRSIDEKQAWLVRDPIKNLKNYIIDNSLISKEKIDQIDAIIKTEIDDAVEFALSSPEPDIGDLKKYLFADD
uniref:Pyruvate dehydrogenase E1 component subunit alpha n=2 Tax=Gracilariopsis TaxID=2781 RepID=A0A1C9CER5_9FLOR|nr:pyruvate dehydrogenase E1 component alpha subunit [Gracilariopsis lemaneiformis]YP_009294621.1 pyruvate dehydrogenase E1 component alpha subunit [Gracilariopsis chorda]AJO68462.1 pyruvate dehydrogenase E1 component alpha ubunit [Gracilariopsis lemaneiformis]AML79815.1 pyruvate dehydrogenase E1 component alpha subunit [Gracilariopsis lemaneiformis]AOM66881.1 pyruvate dehydrogenase E1 component alpha subunit [Gracilariopsis chorda]UAD88858.1 pyruvate dehydrogenase E1 component alpha subunit [